MKKPTIFDVPYPGVVPFNPEEFKQRREEFFSIERLIADRILKRHAELADTPAGGIIKEYGAPDELRFYAALPGFYNEIRFSREFE